MKKTKKMQRGGVNRTGLANQIAAKRREADFRESRPARQEAEYRAAQERRREEGGLGNMLARGAEAVRQAQVRGMNRLLAGEEGAAIGRTRAEANELERQLTDSLSRKSGGVMKKKMGGRVRGDGIAQRGKTKGRFV